MGQDKQKYENKYLCSWAKQSNKERKIKMKIKKNKPVDRKRWS